MEGPVYIIKYSGERVPFEEEKLVASLRRSGAGDELVEKVLERIKPQLKDGETTRSIYAKAFRILKQISRVSAARYNLRKSIMQLGPSGFPFEKFIARIFNNRGFRAQNNLILQGKCVSHEVDVLADRDHKRYIIECKYHNGQSVKSDVKVAMYFRSRVEDLKSNAKKLPGFAGREIRGCLITNTRFTTEAIRYGECMDLLLIGWDHPKHESLKEMIEISGLYPVTCLTTLTRKEKQMFLDDGLVLARTLKNQPERLEKLGLSNYRMKNVREELEALCVLQV